MKYFYEHTNNLWLSLNLPIVSDQLTKLNIYITNFKWNRKYCEILCKWSVDGAAISIIKWINVIWKYINDLTKQNIFFWIQKRKWNNINEDKDKNL